MPVVIIIIAFVLIAVAIRDTWSDLGQLLVGDFTGSNNFMTWLLAIGCIGVLGYVPQLQRFSRVFLALVLVAIFVKQGSGFFDQFTSALENATPSAKKTPPGQTIDAPATSAASDSPGGIAGVIQTITNGGNSSGIGSAITGTLNGLGGAGTADQIKNLPSTILGGISSFGSGLDFGAPGIN